jgi:predicted transcriptional regulator
MYRFFLSKRYVEIFFMLKKHKNIKNLCKESGMTTSHLSTVTDQWEKEFLISKTRHGREVDIEITDKGEELCKLFIKFEKLSKQENGIKE